VYHGRVVNFDRLYSAYFMDGYFIDELKSDVGNTSYGAVWEMKVVTALPILAWHGGDMRLLRALLDC